MPSTWIQESKKGMEKGALHAQLGLSPGKPIPEHVLSDIIDTTIGKKSHGKTVTPLLKRRALWACNVRGGCGK